jgi:secreted trypsin-like serine protease
MTNKWICGAFSILFVISCGRNEEQSNLDVVNGILAADGEFPAVVQIKAKLNAQTWATCSSSIVSDNTILTAAHCIEESGRMLNEIYALVPKDGVIDQRRAHLAKIHPRYRYTMTPYDVAVLVFADETFADVEPLSVASEAPAVSDEITIVGFGKSNHYDPQSGGKKRYGKNTITQVGETLDFVGMTKPIGDGTGIDVLNSQGDSGGPLLWKGDIAGISSSVDYKPGQVPTLAGHYRNVNYPEIKSFFQSMVSNHGARINGLSEN